MNDQTKQPKKLEVKDANIDDQKIPRGDFKNKKQALKWTMQAYQDIDVTLNPKEISIINPL